MLPQRPVLLEGFIRGRGLANHLDNLPRLGIVQIGKFFRQLRPQQPRILFAGMELHPRRVVKLVVPFVTLKRPVAKFLDHAQKNILFWQSHTLSIPLRRDL